MRGLTILLHSMKYYKISICSVICLAVPVTVAQSVAPIDYLYNPCTMRVLVQVSSSVAMRVLVLTNNGWHHPSLLACLSFISLVRWMRAWTLTHPSCCLYGSLKVTFRDTAALQVICRLHFHSSCCRSTIFDYSTLSMSHGIEGCRLRDFRFGVGIIR